MDRASILVIKSTNDSHFLEFLAYLKKRFPTCSMDLLIHGETYELIKAELKGYPLARIYDYAYPRTQSFTLKRLSGFRELFSTYYHIAAVPFFNHEGQGYENVFRVLSRINYESALFFNVERRVTCTTAERFNRNEKSVPIPGCLLADWNGFIGSSGRIEFPFVERPLATILIRSTDTHGCKLYATLDSIEKYADLPYEVTVLIDAGRELPEKLLRRTGNIRILQTERGKIFPEAFFDGVSSARGKWLLFIEEGARIGRGVMRALIGITERGHRVGAVGGKIISNRGMLHSAGYMFSKDGALLQRGLGLDPSRSEFNYVAQVDGCSSVLLLTAKKLFSQASRELSCFGGSLGETDYCQWLDKSGLEIFYQPFASAVRLEDPAENALARRLSHRKMKASLSAKSEKHVSLFSVRRRIELPRILYIDDRVPSPKLGSGFPRSYEFLKVLAKCGYTVSMFPTDTMRTDDETLSNLRMLGIEVISAVDARGLSKPDLKKFLSERRGLYSLAIVSRPHNLARNWRLLRSYDPNLRIIYDAEAFFSMRTILKAETAGRPLSAARKSALLEQEASLARRADAVLTVSKQEQTLFVQNGIANARIVGHVAKTNKHGASFGSRSGILFVGAMLGAESPNEDALLYFCNAVFPMILRRCKCVLHVIGTGTLDRQAVKALKSRFIQLHGAVEDLEKYYNSCRIFVAPTRFAAGIPWKITEAAARGIPSVVTPLIAGQLGWKDGRDLLIGRDANQFADKVTELYSDPVLWIRIKDGGLRRVQRECSMASFTAEIIESLCGFHPGSSIGDVGDAEKGMKSTKIEKIRQ